MSETLPDLFPLHFPVLACTTARQACTFTKEHMAMVWDTLSGEGKTPWLFYDGFVRDARDYIEFMTAPDVFAYVACSPDGSGTPLAMYFVNDFIGNVGKMHFCYTDAGIPYRYAVGVETCNFLLRAGGLSALIGITPKPFRHAWKFACAVGFTQKAVIPEACRLVRPGQADRLVDAVVTLCTKETLLPVPENKEALWAEAEKVRNPRCSR